MKKIIITLTLMLMSLAVITAAAKSDAPYQSADGTNNWNYSINIAESPEGTYNFIVKAIDGAGNETMVGPYNFHVDPASDLPIAAFSFPSEGSKAGSVLNIVGTSYDDDGVHKIEVRLDEEGPWMRAEGSDFWSYLLDTSDIPDGSHTLYVRAHDINALPGPESSVGFILDKSAPANTVDSHPNGVLLSGKNTIAGTLSDANGLASLELSRDEGETFEEISFKYDKDNALYNFAITFDSRDLEDGSYIYWLKSTDTTGSTGVLPFQFYADNQGPELTLISPKTGEEEEPRAYPGVVTFSGQVHDQIGVASLSFTSSIHKEPVEIPLTQGNPYWAYSVDFTGLKDKADIEFRLEDLTGNVSTYRERILLDQEADKPVITLHNEEAAEYSGGSLILVGSIMDDDGAASIQYKIDKGEYQEVSADSAFMLDIAEIAAGPHSIQLIPVDKMGVQGESILYNFTMKPDVPVITWETMVQGEESYQWMAGTELDPRNSYSIRGRIFSESKPTLYYTQTLTGAAELPEATLSIKSTEEAGQWTFALSVKKDSPPGLTDVKLHAIDGFGQEAWQGTSYVVLDKVFDAEGKNVVEVKNSLRKDLFVSPYQEIDGYIPITANSGFSGFINNDVITGASFEEGGEFLNIKVSGNSFQILQNHAGQARNLTLVLETSSGKNYDHTGLNFKSDMEAPELAQWQEISWAPGQERWKSESLEIEGSVTDGTEVSSLSYSLNGAPFKEITGLSSDEAEAGEQDNKNVPFRETIDLTSLAEGFFVLTLKAVDSAGNELVVHKPYIRLKPQTPLTQLTPASDVAVIRETTLSWELAMDDRILNAEFSADGENWEEIPLEKRLIQRFLNLKEFDSEFTSDSFFIRLTDRSGNQTQVSPFFTIDREADKPTLIVQAPLPDSTVRNDFSVSGYIIDNDSIDAVLYRIDDEEGTGEFIEYEGGNTYSIDIPISTLYEGDHFIELQARDSGGILSDVIRRDFKVSLKEPETLVNFPLVEDVVNGVITISGESSDLNDIAEVWISLNNGRTFNKMDGQESWSYLLDTRLLEDGTHSFLLKAIDGAKTEGVFVSLVNIDNENPKLELDFPAEGSNFIEKIEVEGRADDENLSSLILKVEQNGNLLVERELDLKRVVKEEIDATEFPPGTYTLRLDSVDSAGNVSFVSRIVQKPEVTDDREILISFPRKGSVQGPIFRIEGHLIGVDEPGMVTLNMDGLTFASAEVTKDGWFNYAIEEGKVAAGSHIFQAIYRDANGEIITEEWPLIIEETGGWVTMDSVASGDFVRDRPWISGRYGYTNLPLELIGEEEKENQQMQKEWDQINAQMQEAVIMISLDNGITFQETKYKNGQWKYRLETGFLDNGQMSFLVEARFPDGSKRLIDSLMQYDKDFPDLSLINEEVSEGRFNGTVDLLGTSFDENGIQELSVVVREGDKKSYATPGFIQGLYLDIHALGATYFDVGIGLTFFDDNVKLQGQIGLAPSEIKRLDGTTVPGRLTGTVIGGKLLANIGNIPFQYFLGPDWEALSASVAIGANFSYFSMEGEEGGKMLGSILGQVEFPKYSFLTNPTFRYISLYTEAIIWFIPSDAQSSEEYVIPSERFLLSFGLRVGMF